MTKPKVKFAQNVVNTLIIPEKFTVKDYTVEAIYVNENVADAPCFGGHQCNRAMFDITINDVLVLKANLNNSDTGSPPPVMSDGIGSSPLDRYSASVITEEQANLIAQNSRFDFIIQIKPDVLNTDPHENITWVRLKNPSGKIIYSTCVAVGTSTEVTDAILLDASSARNIQFQEKIVLPYSINDLNVGESYQIKYEVIDAQYLNTIPPNERVFKFISPCCNSLVTNETENGFILVTDKPDINCNVIFLIKCVQSALVQISVIKDGAIISRDIIHINSAYCNLSVSNDLFMVNYDNLPALGKRLDSDINFGNNIEKPIIIEASTYTATPITLLCTNLTVNRLYEYKFYFVPLSDSVDIQPETGRFFAGDVDQRVVSMLTLLNPQILIVYASLKDIETGIIKTTKPIYLYSASNCTDMVRNFAYSEIEHIPIKCELKNCDSVL
jgi:hypothetical protein